MSGMASPESRRVLRATFVIPSAGWFSISFRYMTPAPSPWPRRDLHARPGKCKEYAASPAGSEGANRARVRRDYLARLISSMRPGRRGPTPQREPGGEPFVQAEMLRKPRLLFALS